MQSLVFDNAFTRALPADAQSGSERRQVRHALFSRVEPTTVAAPYLIHSSSQVAELLELSEADRASEDFLQVFAGNKLLPGMDATPPATADISLVTGLGSSGTVEPSIWAR